MPVAVYDLCIVGAGVFGCAAARHASANPNLQVCLIGMDEPTEHELQHREIFSSHYDEGRIVKTLFSSPAYQKLAKNTIKSLKDLEKLSGKKFYSPIGFMNIGKKGNRLMKNLEDISSSTGTQLIHVDEDFMEKIYPFLKVKTDEYGLLDFSGAGVVHVRCILEAEKLIIRKQGCHILTDRVTQVRNLRDNYHTIETGAHGDIQAKRVLITTGAFANVNNFEVLPQLEMYMYKEMAAMVRIQDAEVQRLNTMPGMIYKRDEKDIGFYILPPVRYPDGRYYLKIGSMEYDSGKGMQTIPEIREWFLSQEEPGETTTMADNLFKILPGLKSDGIARKVCVTSETPSGFPYIDQVSPTVTIAVSANAWGVSTGEEIGRLAANLSLTGTWDSDIPHSLFEIILKE